MQSFAAALPLAGSTAKGLLAADPISSKPHAKLRVTMERVGKS